MEKICKIYCLKHPITNEIRYIGKTSCSLRKRYREHLFSKKYNYSLPNWIKKLEKNGMSPVMELIKICKNEKMLNYAEKFFIKLYGRLNTNTGRLLNLTEGGEGVTGAVVKESTRKILSEKYIGRKLSEITKQRMSISRTNNPNVIETNRKIGLKNRGIKRTDETRKKCLIKLRKENIQKKQK